MLSFELSLISQASLTLSISLSTFSLPKSTQNGLGLGYVSCLTTSHLNKSNKVTDESDNAHREVYEENKHESHLSHELIAGAASFAGMKAFEDHQRKEGTSPPPIPPTRQRLTKCVPPGKTVSHSTAKEILAALAGAEVDKLAETKGLDQVDKIKAHEHAKKNAEHMYDEHYVRGHGADEYDPNRYGTHDSFAGRGW